ncbi:MAG: RagB/SusD family nutrient uptake outer membrane protein [Parabacteroides merdae]
MITVVDQIAHSAKVRKDPLYPGCGFVTPPTVATAEENSGVRVTKRSPRPTQEEFKRKGDPDVPVIRLAEIYYMLAECKMRAGDKQGAADLINTVRKRYFEDGVDPDPNGC